jgi:ubiquinone/menaquinone biosynthesis C-methylase UbiE
MLTVDFDRLAVRKGHVSLDMGCGFGRHSLQFMARGALLYSLDMDMESLRKTRFALTGMRNEMRKKGLEPEYLVNSGDALKLPYKDGSFDRIICAEVMEHVSDDRAACMELARVLKKTGRIAITVPTCFSELIYDALTYEYFTSPGGHIRKYRPGVLAEIMRSCGLEIYSIGFRHSFHTIWWMIRCVVGLHLDSQPITRAYHKFLHLGLFSPFMRNMERFFNNFFPKSIVLYAWKK